MSREAVFKIFSSVCFLFPFGVGVLVEGGYSSLKDRESVILMTTKVIIALSLVASAFPLVLS